MAESHHLTLQLFVELHVGVGHVCGIAGFEDDLETVDSTICVDIRPVQLVTGDDHLDQRRERATQVGEQTDRDRARLEIDTDVGGDVPPWLLSGGRGCRFLLGGGRGSRLLLCGGRGRGVPTTVAIAACSKDETERQQECQPLGLSPHCFLPPLFIPERGALPDAGRSVGERPTLPVVAYSKPEPIEAQRLKDQETDDQQTVKDQIELSD